VTGVALTVCSLADRPDLAEAHYELKTSWPDFMLEDPTASLIHLLPRQFPELQLVLLDGDQVIGKALAAPFYWPNELAALPDTGWDWVLVRAIWDQRPPTIASALEISILPERQGSGLSRLLVQGLVDAAHGLGLAALVAPVRPSRKAAEPGTPIAEYAVRLRDDGLPADPWLRVHARLGATILRVCPVSMTIPGTLAQWRTWTGLPFDRSGPVVVPGALVPVQVDVEHDYAVYVEPNVWMHHRLG
jgi:GNAT superfamily N-acetyltransferase